MIEEYEKINYNGLLLSLGSLFYYTCSKREEIIKQQLEEAAKPKTLLSSMERRPRSVNYQ